jgi:hypothetical protein
MNAIVALAVTANQLAIGQSKSKRAAHITAPTTPKR